MAKKIDQNGKPEDNLVDDINAKLTDLRVQHSSMQTSIDSMDKNISRLVHLLEGNGHPGLRVRVDRIERDEERRGVMRKVALGSIWSAIAGLAILKIKDSTP